MSRVGGHKLNIVQQVARLPENRGQFLGLKVYTPSGLKARAADTLGEKDPQKLQELLARIDEIRRIDIGIKWVHIPAGNFVFQGVENVSCPGFKLAKTPLTNGQFRILLQRKSRFLEQIVPGAAERLEDSLAVAALRSEAEHCPMTLLTWPEAQALAQILSLRLPSELEWERAAAGRKGNAYPYGMIFDEQKGAYQATGTRSVYAHKKGKSPESIFDLSGNVWEWTSSWAGALDLTNPQNPKLPGSGREIVVRGGAWHYYDLDSWRADCRGRQSPQESKPYLGVRFAAEI
ncbi:MAG: SUMF1/EgtB/PvdO family nonheme iron enzyme [Candidatus Saganbacteria bacterium]|nr:SUMF1/EgtB/PvdO family nonheme iron enzyme [Candidatus Saganbacteria bacterium]